MVVANEYHLDSGYFREISAPIGQHGNRGRGGLDYQAIGTMKGQGKLARTIALELMKVTGKLRSVGEIG
jgi:hypothetical protein